MLGVTAWIVGHSRVDVMVTISFANTLRCFILIYCMCSCEHGNDSNFRAAGPNFSTCALTPPKEQASTYTASSLDILAELDLFRCCEMSRSRCCEVSCELERFEWVFWCEDWVWSFPISLTNDGRPFGGASSGKRRGTGSSRCDDNSLMNQLVSSLRNSLYSCFPRNLVWYQYEAVSATREWCLHISFNITYVAVDAPADYRGSVSSGREHDIWTSQWVGNGTSLSKQSNARVFAHFLLKITPSSSILQCYSCLMLVEVQRSFLSALWRRELTRSIAVLRVKGPSASEFDLI